MKEKIKIGYVGLGRRGYGVLKECFSQMKDVEVVCLCDKSDERIARAVEVVEKNGGYTPRTTHEYQDILNDPAIDAVVIMTGWSGRPALAMQAMRAGKYTAIEVGCADTLQECFDLVDTYEETGVPVMMLENCCYGRREMMLLNMVKKGLFGELVHCTGGYQHYLKEELFGDLVPDEKSTEALDSMRAPAFKNFPHYRLEHYIKRNRDNYPTHALGPICKILDINRGNRMVRLNAIASKARALRQCAEDYLGADSEFANIEYKQGDIVNTVITCANGETILLTLDTTAPRAYYSRNLSVRGTKAMSSEERKVVYLSEMEEGIQDNEKEFFEKYDHPLHVEYEEMGPTGGHGGMDWLVCRAFVESVKTGTNTPIDAYDAAAWLSIGVLTEQSIAQNGAPVDIPDFTKGKWEDREPAPTGKYCLAQICEDRSVSIF